jgi:hypothetical protein
MRGDSYLFGDIGGIVDYHCLNFIFKIQHGDLAQIF